ncbi:MAG: hypothetical protein KHW47_08845, partial [Actinotignum schaalii]|nr:hypothetical protein [Actinotignum schaalii]
KTLLEAFGWLGSLLVVISLILPKQRNFRFWNFVGSGIAASYNLNMGIWPMVIMNTAIVIIDLYWLQRLIRKDRDHRKDADSNAQSQAPTPASNT